MVQKSLTIREGYHNVTDGWTDRQTETLKQYRAFHAM